jgi:hypothetical protein
VGVEVPIESRHERRIAKVVPGKIPTQRKQRGVGHLVSVFGLRASGFGRRL